MDENTKKFKINAHLVVLALILIVFGTAVFILLRWNQGETLEEDSSETATDFTVEAMDMIIPLPPGQLDGREDDGVKTILCLGNNPFTDETGEKGLAARIAAQTSATVINGAFPDSVIACEFPEYNPAYPRDAFNLYYVTQALLDGQFARQEEAAVAETDERYQEGIGALEEVDMEKVDTLVIMYDTTDYNTLSPGYNPENDYDLTAYTGALRTALEEIRTAWPHIRIFLMSHTYARYLDEDGKLHNGTVTDLGNGDLPHYLVLQYETALNCGVTFIDNYFGTINEGNYQDYMTDHMHYNDAGRELLAERVAALINED